METITGLVTADFKSIDSSERKPSVFGRLITFWRKAAADRRLRDQLAGMDDALLRDIGIAEDEITRIRSFDRFTPRAWSGRRTA